MEGIENFTAVLSGLSTILGLGLLILGPLAGGALIVKGLELRKIRKVRDAHTGIVVDDGGEEGQARGGAKIRQGSSILGVSVVIGALALLLPTLEIM